MSSDDLTEASRVLSRFAGERLWDARKLRRGIGHWFAPRWTRERAEELTAEARELDRLAVELLQHRNRGGACNS